jgi:hypothetical protein
MRWLYLCLAVFGAVLPYSQFIPWLAVHGLNVRLLFAELFVGHVSASLDSTCSSRLSSYSFSFSEKEQSVKCACFGCP